MLRARAIAILSLALWLSACGDLVAPAAPSPTAPSPSAAERIDPRALLADPSSFAGRNILLWGTIASSSRAGSSISAILRAMGPYYRESPVPLDITDGTLPLQGDCYEVYGVAGPGAHVRAYKLHQLHQESDGICYADQ